MRFIGLEEVVPQEAFYGSLRFSSDRVQRRGFLFVGE